MMAVLLLLEVKVSPTLAVAETQFSPSEPVSASPILLVTLPGKKKKKNALALVDAAASNRIAKDMVRFIFSG